MKRFSVYLAVLAVIADAAAIFAGLMLAYVIRAKGFDIYNWPIQNYFWQALVSLPIWIIMLAFQGLYKIRKLPLGAEAVSKVAVGLFSGWGAIIIILYLSRIPEAQNFSRLALVYGVLLTMAFIYIDKLILLAIRRIAYANGSGIINTILISDNHKEFEDFLWRSDKSRKIIKVLGRNCLDELEKINGKSSVDEVIVADSEIHEDEILKILSWAESRNAGFVLVPGMFDIRTANVEMGSIAGKPVIYYLRTPLDGWGRVAKRLLDIVLVIPAIVIVSPILIVEYLLVKLTSTGPALYREPRVGQDGSTFYVRKFRSMYTDWKKRFPDVQDWSINEKTDPRITPVGRFIRKTNIDEIPQFFDVLVGKMSLVGPRPEQPKYVEKFAHEVPNYLRRHHVKSGLTGWAQINGLRGDTSIEERVKYDLYYIENWSIWFDIRIVLSTFNYIIKELAK